MKRPDLLHDPLTSGSDLSAASTIHPSSSRIAPDRSPRHRTVYHAASPPDRVGAVREPPCAHLRVIVIFTVAPDTAHHRPASHRITTPSSTCIHTPNHQGTPRNALLRPAGHRPYRRCPTPPIVVPHRTGPPAALPERALHPVGTPNLIASNTKPCRDAPRNALSEHPPIAGSTIRVTPTTCCVSTRAECSELSAHR